MSRERSEKVRKLRVWGPARCERLEFVTVLLDLGQMKAVGLFHTDNSNPKNESILLKAHRPYQPYY